MKDKRKLLQTAPPLALLLLAILTARLIPESAAFSPAGLLTAAAGSWYVLLDLRLRERFEQIAVSAGYGIRLALVIVESYWPALRPYRLGTRDAAKFYRVAQEYFSGDFSTDYTTYPYVISALFKFFGQGWLVPLFVNVLCWYLGWTVIRSVLDDCPQKQRRWLTLFYSFMPASLLLTTELLRESIMMLFIALSFYSLWRWMRSGRYVWLAGSLAAAAPAIVLHSVSVALWGTALAVFLFWDADKQMWRLSKKRLPFLFGFAVLGFCFFYFKLYGLFEYFPKQITVHDLTWRPFDLTGRTNYLMDVEVTTWTQYFAWTPVRCAYFWLSPVVLDWSSPLDAAAVAFDVIPLLALLVMILHKPSQAVSKAYWAGVIALTLYTLLYAWGVTNAGAALRHRNMLEGVMVMTYGMRSCAVKTDG